MSGPVDWRVENPTSAELAPVDVLAVMDAEIARSSNLPTAADPYVIERHHAMVDARAAVADAFAALTATEELLAFHEGSAKPEFEGAHPTVRVNGEDWAELTAKVRAALARVGAA